VGCTVVSGDWLSPYDAQQWTLPSAFDRVYGDGTESSVDDAVALAQSMHSARAVIPPVAGPRTAI
jgi:hypothetical protein